MLKSKIAMALAAAMVMAALYGCSSSSNDGKITQLEGQVGTLTDDAAAVLAKLRTTAEGLEIAVPADATAEEIADLLAGAGPDVVTTDPVEDEKAAEVVGPAILGSEMTEDGARTMDNPRIAVDGDSVTDLGEGDEVGGEGAAADTKLEMSSMGEVGGFGGGVYSQVDDEDDPKVVDSVYVYTNKAGSTDSEYNAFFADNADTDSEARKGLSGITEPTDEDATLNVLSIENSMVSANTAYFKSPDLPSANGSFMVYEDDDMTPENERMFAGKFRGVDGTYECTGNDACRAEHAAGKLSLAGDWTFTADEPEEGAMVMVTKVVPDSDYLTFGFWLREDTTGDDPVAMIETLYGTKMVYDASTAAGLTGDNAGKATYSGAATGKFIRKEFNSAGMDTVVAGGAFTAKADLTAYFGELGSVAADNHNMVSGDITEFMSGGDYIYKKGENQWSVKLEATSFQGGGTTPFVGTTVGDEDADAGAWEGQFAGPTMKAAPTESEPDALAPVQPSGIVGEFNGHFTNGHVVGAFGATKDE